MSEDQTVMGTINSNVGIMDIAYGLVNAMRRKLKLIGVHERQLTYR